MRNVWIIACHEYHINVRRTGFIIVTALIPAAALIAFAIMAFFSQPATQFLAKTFAGNSDKPIGVVDESGLFTPILPEFQAHFRLYQAQAAAEKAIAADRIAAALVIPQDYMANGAVRVLISDRNHLLGDTITDSKQVNAFFVSHLLRHSTPALRERAAHPAKFSSVEIGTAGGKATHVLDAMVVPYILSIFLIITIFTAAGYLLQGIAEEKENRIVEIILSSVSSTELLAGKVIGLGAVGLTQVSIWLLTVLLFSGAATMVLALNVVSATSWTTLLLALVYYVLGFTMYAVLMAATGSIGSNLKEAQQISGVFSFMAAIPYMVMGVAIANPNALGLRLLSWFPLTAPTMMLVRFPLGSVPTIDIFVSIAGLLVSIPLLLWAGARLFRLGILMYGKRPSLRAVWQMWRSAD